MPLYDPSEHFIDFTLIYIKLNLCGKTVVVPIHLSNVNGSQLFQAVQRINPYPLDTEALTLKYNHTFHWKAIYPRWILYPPFGPGNSAKSDA